LNAFRVKTEIWRCPTAKTQRSPSTGGSRKKFRLKRNGKTKTAIRLARDPSENGGRRVVFISSNGDAAANKVKILAEQLGFSPILLGRVDEGGRLLQIDGGLILHNLVEWPLK
jgi:hypothetical protein